MIAKAYILNFVNDMYSAPSDSHLGIICLLVEIKHCAASSTQNPCISQR